MAAITAGRSTQDAGPARGRRAGLAGALRSEFTKLRSVRSTYWALALLVLAGMAWSVANCAGVAAHWAQTPPQARGLDATQDSVAGLALLGQLIVVVLGTLAITSEYSTGMIRTSLTVLPRRGVVFAAKAIVLTVVTLVIATATSFAAFFVGQYLLRSTHQAATLGQPNVLRAVLAAPCTSRCPACSASVSAPCCAARQGPSPPPTVSSSWCPSWPRRCPASGTRMRCGGCRAAM